MAGPILVATDGTPAALGAVRFAHALAARDGLAVEVVTVYEPPTAVYYDLGFAVTIPEAELELEGGRSRDLLDLVRRQVASVMGPGHSARIDLMMGSPAHAIVRAAQLHEASLIVLGLGRHRPVDRWLGSETALRVTRTSPVPVFAAHRALAGLPRHALFALDFSSFSAAAAEAAARLLDASATVELVHVARFPMGAPQELRDHYLEVASQRVAAVHATLALPSTMTARRHLLEGDPVRELLGMAQREEVDLVVTGSHGHSFLSRLVIGSVSTRLLRRVRCSMLIAPPGQAPVERPVAVPEETQRRWAAVLHAFNDRNLGRPVVLELEHPEFGRQESGRGYPFQGAAYDPRDGRLEIMLGYPGRTDLRLTRTIEAPSALEVLTAPDGRDQALRVVHGAARTLVRILPS